MKSVYLKCRTNRSDGAKHPTQSESKIQPRACELLLGLLVNCLQIWQYISSLNSARRIPCPIMKCSFSKFEVGLVPQWFKIKNSIPKFFGENKTFFAVYMIWRCQKYLWFIFEKIFSGSISRSAQMNNQYESRISRFFFSSNFLFAHFCTK